MIKPRIYAGLLALVAAGSLTACAGDSGGYFVGSGAGNGSGNGNGNGNGSGIDSSCDMSTIAGVTCYINNLIATATLDTNNPTDISALMLASDETSEATPAL